MNEAINLGDWFTIVDLDEALFFKKHPCTHGENWNKFPDGESCDPTDVEVYEYEDTEEQVVEMSEAYRLEDDNSNVYFRLVGDRPKGTRRN